ncbi:hypothetical protein PROFUN_00771 [Planoprotostelium fungivorum]|uniref:Mitochondrial import inner membrane translocase subunit n=1 Tax=Planoprotostelium fungivorum TaxID=1890364 RepID=A0A2P6NZY9_9EUKA|nr:hypothetical protein PROFUN_00771 [Planoprotostelium fungivorum]
MDQKIVFNSSIGQIDTTSDLPITDTIRQHTGWAKNTALVDNYRRMVDQCFRKCITSFGEPELSKAESSCIDRCTQKYSETAAIVDERSRETTKANEEQAALMQKQWEGLRGGVPPGASQPIPQDYFDKKDGESKERKGLGY